MFITTIGALLYKAYEAFFINLPKVETLAKAQKLTVGEVTAANVIIGLVALVLIGAALILAWDAFQVFQKLRAAPKLAAAKAKE